jgi:hypothetical protein
MYQPVMSEENVRRLYFLKQEKKRPMTTLLDQILNEYFEQHKNQNSSSENQESKKGGETKCTSAKSAETPSKSNLSRKAMIVTTLDTGTVPSAEPSTTP